MRHTQRRHPWAACLVTPALFVLLGAADAAAQTSRAEEIAQQQLAKRAVLEPNEPDPLERGLAWVEDYFTSPDVVFVTIGGLYPSAGFAPGVSWRHAMGPARLQIGGAWSLRNYKLGQASMRFPALAGERLSVETHVRWLDATQVPFYGLGNDTAKEARANYGLRSTDAGGSAAYTLAPWLTAGGGVALQLPEDRAGKGSRPSIEAAYPTTAPGLFTDPTYIRSTATLAVDTRESPGYTRSGGYYAVTLHDFHDRDDANSFRRVDVDVRQFVPILKEQWVIGLRGLLQTTDADAGATIPYYLLPSLGGNASLRAYPDFRFQDRHLLLLSAEYRWFPSRALDLAIFADAGQVAPRREDLHLDRLKTGYGIGARFHGPAFTPLRLDVARGREGIRVNLTGSVAF